MKRLLAILWISILAVSSNFSQTTHVVNTTDDTDDGLCNATHCSLREAINAANLDGTVSFIHFNFVSTSQVNLTASLPAITDAFTTIDGTTALGAVIVDGAGIISGGDAITIEADRTTILGLQIQNSTAAIQIGNLSTTPLKDITIGAPSKGNILVSNIIGVSALQANSFIENLLIQANYIGTNANYVNLGNAAGISIFGNNNNNIMIGGDASLGEGNYVCFSGDHGILTESNSFIYGNKIGTGVSGTEIMGNAFYGVMVGNNCTVGDFYYGFRNYIAYNGGAGINSICSTCNNNTYSSNRIYCNGIQGIENNGNISMPAPIILNNDGSTISGTAQAFATVEVFIEISDCTVCQGYELLDNTTADASGNWSISGNSFTGKVSATATDVNGNTSEFSGCFSPNECMNAIGLPVENIDCVNTFFDIQTEFTTASSEPFQDCNSYAPTGTKDVWAKAIVPSTGALMVQLRAATSTIDAMVEVYTGSCGSLTFVKCDSLFTDSHAFPVQLPPSSTVFLRIFDQFDTNTGVASIGLRELPTNPSDWTLCYDAVDDRKANEFIIQYDADATAIEIQDIMDDLIASGAQLLDECNCAYKPLQLWEATNPIEVEERRRLAKSKAKADTTSYNFIIDEQICEQASSTVTITYTNGANGWAYYTTVNLDNYNSVSCTQTGVIETLPALPYNPVAWTKRVNVAVIDTGVEETHDHIENAIWNNPEINDTDNCVLNDLIGYDFKNRVGSPNDIDGHGTNVNGLIASGFPNDIKLDLMNVKFIENDNSTLFDAICAMYYAIDNGAQVMNLSWGFITSEGLPTILKDVLDYAKQKDVLVITSAGNRGLNNDATGKFPANYEQDNIIAVAAYEQISGNDPIISPYSNFGATTVDIAALGYVETATLGNTTSNIAGTSIAAPLVTRTAAVIRACYPMLSASEVKNCILSSADIYSGLMAYVATSGVLNHTAALNCAYSSALSKCNTSDVFVNNDHYIDSLILTDTRIFSDALVTVSTDITYKAGNCINLQMGFEVELGASFLAFIEGCNGTILPPFTEDLPSELRE